MEAFDVGRISSRRSPWGQTTALLGGFPFGVSLYVPCHVDLQQLTRQYDGQEGVELAVRILRQELRITMALAGYVCLCLV